jgi:hypothetical protein
MVVIKELPCEKEGGNEWEKDVGTVGRRRMIEGAGPSLGGGWSCLLWQGFLALLRG